MSDDTEASIEHLVVLQERLADAQQVYDLAGATNIANATAEQRVRADLASTAARERYIRASIEYQEALEAYMQGACRK